MDNDHFRRALARLASGVTIVTTVDGAGRPAGFTATAFSALSLEPPLVLVCLDKRAESHAVFRSAGRYGVSVLASGQEDLARRFATKGIDKFHGVPTVGGRVAGLPLIAGAGAHLECRVVERIDGGDHTIFVGEVLSAESAGREPLLYFDRQFGRFTAARDDEAA